MRVARLFEAEANSVVSNLLQLAWGQGLAGRLIT